MNWKRFTALTSSALALAGIVKLAIACAGGDADPYDEYPTFFFNTINKDPAFPPFYYTDLAVFYTDGVDPADLFGEVDPLPDPNVAEWSVYTGKRTMAADIDSFVYSYPRKYALMGYEHIVKNAPLAVPAEVRNNTFFKWLLRHRDKAALQYLVFAKECADYGRPIEEYWDDASNTYKTPVRSSDSAGLLIAKGLVAHAESKSDFLKWRYAYQIIRTSFYSDQYERTLRLYDSLIGNRAANNVMYHRCLALKGGALYKLGKEENAAYLYSRVFDQSDELKKKAFQSFRWAVHGNITEVLPLCQNEHERAVLYLMRSLYVDDSDAINTIGEAYKRDPHIRGLEVAMTREINKMEKEYMTDIYALPRSVSAGWLASYYADIEDKGSEKKRAENRKSLARLVGFAEQVSSEKQRNDDTYWNLAKAYLYYMQGNYPGCLALLSTKVEKTNRTGKDVHDVIAILCLLHRDGKISEKTESDMLPYLRDLEKRAGNKKRFAKLYCDLLQNVIGPQYLRQKDTMRSIFALSRNANPTGHRYIGDFTYESSGVLLESLTPERLGDLATYLQRPNKSAYEHWLLHNTQYDKDVIRDLEGTKFIRQMEFEKAVATLKQVEVWRAGIEALPDFLVSHISDNSEWNRSDSAFAYTKLEFAGKMNELQQKLRANPADGRAAYQYANGLYSMSYYGKAHHAYDYYRSSTDDNAYYATDERKKLPWYAQEYYSVTKAREYYIIAYKNTTDDEAKARCLFMAAKCWQKNAPVGTADRAYGDNDDYYKNSLKNPYFKDLRGYRNTRFFHSAYSTCSYFKDYLKAK